MGSYLSSPVVEKIYDDGKNEVLSYCAASMQGWRNSMEDAHIASINLGQETSVFGVFDGHGGGEVALFVKEHFIDVLTKNEKFKKREDLDLALKETFIEMDRLMITKEGTAKLMKYKQAPNQEPDLNLITAGCTANVALIYKNQLFVANSGDSRSVLCTRNKPFEMSKDHKPDETIELTRIREAGGFVVNGRVNGNLNLSRAMGDFEYKGVTNDPINNQKVYCRAPEKALITVVPDVKSRALLAAVDRFLLMGCDGIWECKTNEELIQFVNDKLDQKIPLRDILKQLLEQIIATDSSKGIGCDNMTVLLVIFEKQSVQQGPQQQQQSYQQQQQPQQYQQPQFTQQQQFSQQSQQQQFSQQSQQQQFSQQSQQQQFSQQSQQQQFSQQSQQQQFSQPQQYPQIKPYSQQGQQQYNKKL